MDQINQTIREHLQAKSELPANQLSVKTLHAQDIAKVDLEKGAVGSVFKVGQVLTLNSQALKNQDKDLVKGSQWQIINLNQDGNNLTVQSLQQPSLEKTFSGKGLIKTHASVSELKEIQLSVGDEVRFTVSDPVKRILTNETATVKDIKPLTGELTLSKPNGQAILLDGSQALNLDYNYAKTTFSAQGQTAERVLYHAQSTSTNLMNQRDFYVGLSRATNEITVITDSIKDLSDLVEKSTGEKMTSLENEPSTHSDKLTMNLEADHNIEITTEKTIEDDKAAHTIDQDSLEESQNLSDKLSMNEEKSAEFEK